MTEEERRIISAFVERMAGVSAPQPSASPWGGSSVPATQSRPPLPPVDPEADQLITELFSRYPEARYRLTQTAFVQEHALVQAQNRIQDLEWQLENAQRQAQAQAQTQQQSRGGMFGGLFGGGGAAQQRPVPMTPRPQPVMPPQGMNPAMMQGGRGPSFLGSALTTAAGVAGGMVMGNMLMNMFSGGGAAEAASAAAGDAAGAAGDFAQEAVPASSPWTDPGQDATQASNDAYGDNQGFDDAAGYDDAGGFEDEDI